MKWYLMSNTKTYPWLSTISTDMDPAILHAIDKKEWPDVKKDAMAKYCASQKEKDPEHLRKIERSNTFKKALKEECMNAQSEMTLCSIVIIMTGTLFVYFLSAVLFESYVINFSVDAIVGSIALVLLVRNEILKTRLSKKYLQTKEYLYMDILAIIFSFLCHLMMRHFDITLIVLLAVYYFSKHKWTKIMNEFMDGE